VLQTRTVYLFLHGRPRYAKLSVDDFKKARLLSYIRILCEAYASVPDGIRWVAPYHYNVLYALEQIQVWLLTV